MHELSIVCGIVDQVLEVVREEGLSEVEAIVLEVGAMSTVVPEYLTGCYPNVVGGTMLEKTELRIEELAAAGRCRGCGGSFDFVIRRGVCPGCGGKDIELLSGREFKIKEIVAR
ncbi:MAG: hydrogenase maturation nickel metallochaperone HypA [Clostridiales bacterium]|nr:hydrogenase maturation nickel metallochaperone HypA [Clostridiales bacterium]